MYGPCMGPQLDLNASPDTSRLSTWLAALVNHTSYTSLLHCVLCIHCYLVFLYIHHRQIRELDRKQQHLHLHRRNRMIYHTVRSVWQYNDIFLFSATIVLFLFFVLRGELLVGLLMCWKTCAVNEKYLLQDGKERETRKALLIIIRR